MRSSQHDDRKSLQQLTPMQRRLIGNSLLKAGRKTNEPSMFEVGSKLLADIQSEENRHTYFGNSDGSRSSWVQLPELETDATFSERDQKTSGGIMKVFRWILVLAMLIGVVGAIGSVTSDAPRQVQDVAIPYGISSFFALLYLLIVGPSGKGSWLSLEIEARKAKLRKRIRDADGD